MPSLLTQQSERSEAPNGLLQRLRRFSVAEYHQLIEMGILGEDDPYELIEGWIVEKMPHNPPHTNCVRRANRVLARILPDEFLLNVQLPITIGESEPEPDFSIIRGPEDRYIGRKAGSRDVMQIIEVSDSSLEFDRDEKCKLYARHRIGVYWIIDLAKRCIEVYTSPKSGKAPAYRHMEVFASSQTIPLVIDGEKIADIPVSDLLNLQPKTNNSRPKRT